MIKPFLILQLRPEDEAAHGEFEMFLRNGKLPKEHAHRVRMEKDGLPEIDLYDYSGVIVGGGPFNVSDPDTKKLPEQQLVEIQLDGLLDEIIERDFPYLGACYGLGALSKRLGGRVSKEKYAEPIGAAPVRLTKDAAMDPLSAGFPARFKAFLGHKEACQDLPPGAKLLVTSDTCPIQMIRVKNNIYATQFHPECDPEGFARRIDVYRHAGYFHPDDAERLMDEAMRQTVTEPVAILQRFIARYSQLLAASGGIGR